MAADSSGEPQWKRTALGSAGWMSEARPESCSCCIVLRVDCRLPEVGAEKRVGAAVPMAGKEGCCWPATARVPQPHLRRRPGLARSCWTGGQADRVRDRGVPTEPAHSGRPAAWEEWMLSADGSDLNRSSCHASSHGAESDARLQCVPGGGGLCNSSAGYPSPKGHLCLSNRSQRAGRQSVSVG